MSSERRHHLNDYARRYREAAAAGAWDVAETAAIMWRRYACDTDETYADALYAEGYARERLGDVQFAGACYELAALLTDHPEAIHRLALVRGMTAGVG